MSTGAFAQWTETNMGFESGNTSGWTIGANNNGTMTTTINGNGTGISLITGTPGTVTFNAGSHPDWITSRSRHRRQCLLSTSS